MPLLDQINHWLGRSYRPPGDNRFYLEMDGAKKPVNPRYDNECIGLDTNSDRFLDADELSYMTQECAFRVDPRRWVEEHKYAYTQTPLPELKDYPSYQQCTQQLQDLTRRYPDQARLESLGKSHEGRDIWALHLGQRPELPTVVVTGLTHAREWPSLSIPLALAKDLLEGHDPRLQQCNVCIVPLVNPDGYEYSRTTDPQWRKNRNPEAPVDLNRNYFDPAHPELYRPAGDKPDSSFDDVGASDNPAYSVYRGARGASEPEVQALEKLTFNPQVIASLENHCCGELLLFPQNGDRAVYEQVGQKMRSALGDSYKIESSAELYPVSGGPNEIQEARGQLAMTLESGLSFQPTRDQLEQLVPKAVAAHKIFIDQALQLKAGLGAS